MPIDPNKYPSLKPHEVTAINKLETLLAEANVSAQYIAKQGGQKAIDQKERAAANMLQQNIHRGGK